jgi:serine/threonine-protein kinase HipA
MEEQSKEIKALIDLHRGLRRLGPGDASFSRQILSILPELPENPRIVDLGCGTGAGTLILADWYKTQITAVDFSRAFLEELHIHAEAAGLGDLILTEEADIGKLNWTSASIDLLWSEGAAYNLTFAGALNTWRPLMAPKGIAVVSEISWFTEEIPAAVLEYWEKAYPEIATETENSRHAIKAGFEVIGIHRLPNQVWWTQYYEPLRTRMNELRPMADPILQAVIDETEIEIELFKNGKDSYGYTFYLLKAAS